VHTGNCEMLIDNGLTNSKPMLSSEVSAVLWGRIERGAECKRIVFSPVRELPDEFVDKLSQFTNCFLRPSEEFNTMKLTLTIASEEFGVGMHKNNAAMCMLLLGKKKCYMTLTRDLEGDSKTHLRLFQKKSLHKCILRQGEILFMLHKWYHEIFNLGEYMASIQALPE
jgi:hypothetical protein